MLTRSTPIRNEQGGPSIAEMRDMLDHSQRTDFYPELGKGRHLQYVCSDCHGTQSEFWTVLNGKPLCSECVAKRPNRLGANGD